MKNEGRGRGRPRGRGARSRPKSGRKARPARAGGDSEPSDARILGALRGGAGGRDAAEIAARLRVDRSQDKSLRRRLARLEAEGRVVRRGRRYQLARSDGLVEGALRTSRDAKEIWVEVEGVRWRVEDPGDARPGDRVLLQPHAEGRADAGPGRAGDVLQVLEGHRDHWVGIVRVRGRGGRVTPYRDDALWSVVIADGALGGARSGDVVAVEPVDPTGGEGGEGRGARRRRDGVPLGRVREVLGRPGDPDADAAAVIWRRRLPVAFPPSVERSVRALPDGLDPAECARRVDLRERPFFTIDPASARDHDDAVCVTPGRRGVALQVAIADVSHYVAEGSALDREALRRGNSVYLPDRAIPMLPERLSGDLCSLREGVDRLALVAELEIASSGRVQRRSFFPALIRSRARLVYADAARVMEGDTDPAISPEVAEQLVRLHEVARALHRRRRAEGALDLDLPESEIVLDAEGSPADVVETERTCAHRAVEEAMLAANRAVAGVLLDAKVPCIFRNHEPPLESDASNLLEVLAELGLVKARDDLSPRTLARALERAAGRPIERMVNRAVLRSMRQARYGAVNHGHFALAFDHYVHFTSPIRRYADLEVHRALRAWLEHERGTPGRQLAAVAGQISLRERVAVGAEREVLDLAKCAVMRRHLGEILEGTVTGVARHGVYVTPDAPRAEGLVHVSSLPGYFALDERETALVAGRSGMRFGLGDRLRVRVDRVDSIKAYINFSLAPEPRRGKAQRARRT